MLRKNSNEQIQNGRLAGITDLLHMKSGKLDHYYKIKCATSGRDMP